MAQVFGVVVHTAFLDFENMPSKLCAERFREIPFILKRKGDFLKFLDHPAFAGQFLGADESGIETLTDQITGLHQEIVKQV